MIPFHELNLSSWGNTAGGTIVLGRGRNGLVLKGEYGGYTVAVKRFLKNPRRKRVRVFKTLPSRCATKPNNTQSWSLV